MNERIKELRKQAWDYVVSCDEHLSKSATNLFEGKFAELILLDLINTINDIRTANACVFTTFDKSITDCVKVEIIKLIETTYGIKE